jgi:SAM-dependent methyltransferase
MTWWMAIICFIILLFGFVVIRGAPYVPSHRRFVRLALTQLHKLSKDDVLVDLGSGDGIVLRLAAEQGSRAIGYELNPALVVISRLLARGNRKIETRLADFWLVDLPVETTVVYAFVVTRDVVKLEKKMQTTVDKWGHSVWLITYGAQLKNKQPTEILQAHSLYLFDPSR